MNLCIYEDIEAQAFGALALLRPVFALRCGIFTLVEKLALAFPEAKVHLLVRSHLEAWTKELYPDAEIGEPPEDDTIFVNGRLCMTDDEVLHFMAASPQEVSYVAQGTLFAAKVRGSRVKHVVRHLREGDPDRAFEDVRLPAEVQAFLASSGADLIRWSPRQILQDARYLFEGGVVQGAVDPGAHFLKAEAIHIARGARIMAGAVLNAEGGPIVVRENATVEPLAYVEGPAAIGESSIVRAGAKIRGGTSIGPVCRVGGEVAETVFQGYANKQHDGFLGHSYVGSWVNIAADCINSDLKNTYGKIRVPINGRDVDTGEMFVGMFVGDYSKAGINVSFPTGAVIGFCSSVFAARSPKFVPSFAWLDGESVQRYDEERGLAIARKVMARRQCTMTADEEQLFLAVRQQALAVEKQTLLSVK